MFGMKKRVERVRQALIQALQKKSATIMMAYNNLKPEQIPKNELARAQVLYDLAEILANLFVEEHPDDDKND